MIASVIIPSYKRSVQLTDCVNSLFAQEFAQNEFEIIVVDNSSEQIPELKGFCAENGHHIIRYIHEPVNGLHNARHAGARAARGDILVYIDDDVICPPDWLASMLAPYYQVNADMVAGKVVLKYEAEPPEWLLQFSGILSAFDLGDKPQRIMPPGSWVGCNMSLRKSVLYELGGFNPDGFGDKSLIKYRGDGECGLTRKAHEKGKILWYAPQAWLQHCVPVSRMTPEYIGWRSAIGGIESAYVDLRYNNLNAGALAVKSLKDCLYYLYHRFYSSYLSRSLNSKMLHHAAKKTYQYRLIQRLRQISSPSIRAHTARGDYLEPFLISFAR